MDFFVHGTYPTHPRMPSGYTAAAGVVGEVQAVAIYAQPGERMVLRSPDACVRWTVTRHTSGQPETVVYDTGPSSCIVVDGPCAVANYVTMARCTVHYVPGRGSLGNTAAVAPTVHVFVAKGARELVRPPPVIVADSACPAAFRDSVDLAVGVGASAEICVPPGMARTLRVQTVQSAVVQVVSWLSGTILSTTAISVAGALLAAPVYGRVFAFATAVQTPATFTWDPGA